MSVARRRRSRRAALLGLSLLLLGCRTLLGTGPGQPRLVPIVGEEARIQAWLERARADGQSRLSVRAYGRVRLESDGTAGRFREVVAVERPDRLRFETLNFLGQTQSLLTTDGERFSFFDGQRIERGLASEDLLTDRVGLDLAPAQAIGLLLAAPSLSREAPRRIFAQGQRRVARVGDQRVQFEGDGTLGGVESFDPAGRVHWSVEYSDWRQLPEGRYPMKIGFHFPATGFRLEIELEEVELNLDLDPMLFSIASNEQE